MVEHRPRLLACLLLVMAGCAPDGSVALGPPAARVSRAVDLGRLDPLASVDFVVGVALRDPEGVHRLLSERVRLDGPVAVDQFASRFAAGPDEYQRVVAWLRAQGLGVTRLADGRTTISVSGPAFAVERAFGVEMHLYRLGNETFAAASTAPRLPADVVGSVSGIVGLSGSPGWHTHLAFARPAAPNTGLTASDLIKMYNAGSISMPGMGETVAILGAGPGPDPAIDVGHFVQNAFGTSFMAQYTQVTVGTVAGDSGPGAQGEEVENSLDAEMVLAMAPYAHVMHVLVATNTPGLFTDGISYIVNQLPQAHAVTVSYGSCERGSASEMPVLDTLFLQAQAEGQQWFFSSGDTGTDTCGDGGQNKHVSVDWPASSPYVIGVGGTMFDANNNEVAWNQLGGNPPGAGGGGPSEVFPKPPFQMGVSPNDGARDLPDVAAFAAEPPGVNVNTFNQVISVGGTSAASPMWAGVWALVDQGKGGKGIIDGLTRLYNTAKATPTAFNDITKGDNGGPNDTGAGYPAGPGYDLATGWGTPNVANLVASFQ